MRLSIRKPDGTRLNAEVQGQSAPEVSQVAKELMKGTAREPITMHISDSNIGVLNTGEIKNVENLSSNIKILEGKGQADVACALTNIAQAVLDSNELADTQRTAVLAQLDHLGKEAAQSEDKRTPHVVIKPIFDAIGTTLSAAGGAAAVWSTWGPAIRAFFGF
jgi:hypothetical protein